MYLPDSYYDSTLKATDYPVVYLLDGETNFNYFSTLMEKLAQGIPNVPEMIVIGIENTQRERGFLGAMVIVFGNLWLMNLFLWLKNNIGVVIFAF